MDKNDSTEDYQPLEIRNIGQPDEKVIRTHVYWAVAGGLIPIPILDLATVTAIQLDMLKSLCRNHQVSYDENKGKTFISALAGSALASVFSSVIKAIPGIGTLVGGLSMPVLSGAATYAVGKVFSDHFQSGGNLNDFRVENFKTYYKQQFEDGKSMAEEFKEGYKPGAKEREKTVAAELKHLWELKQEGAITEEEYLEMKTSLIKKMGSSV